MWSSGIAGFGLRGLRIPLRVPAQAGGDGELVGDGELGVYVHPQLTHRSAVNVVAGDEGLLITADIVGQKCGQRVVIELRVEIGLALLTSRIVREVSAQVQLQLATHDRQTSSPKRVLSERIQVRIDAVAAQHAESVDDIFRQCSSWV